MELLDVLDENGNKTGVVEDRSEVYKKGLWHRASHIWIINDQNEILMQKRNPMKKTYPNLWAISVAGHVDSGENSRDTAIRECKEEVNLDVKPDELEYLFTLKRQTPYEDHYLNVFDDVYLLKRNIDVEQTKLQVEELTDIKYVYYEYLEKIFKDGDKDYVPYTEEHRKLFDILKERNAEVI